MEFALISLVLFVLIFAIIDFGIFFYNDLALTQVARDAVRYASVGDQGKAEDAITAAPLISTSLTLRVIDIARHGEEASVILSADYHAITPLPGLIGLGNNMGIDTTARMRRE